MDATKKSKKKDPSSKNKSKKSGVRTKFLIESLRNDYYALRDENERLRRLVQETLPEAAAKAILAECFDPNSQRVKVDSIDQIAGKMAQAGIDDDDDNDAVGF